MSTYQKIVYSVQAAVARVTLNRPEKRNALDDEILHEIADAIGDARSDETVRVVLLTGAGKDFCSGADLAGLRRTSEASVLDNMASARNLSELVIAMRRHPKPIIGAVRGRALAGGCGLATACDLVLASESAKFGYPEVNIGFIPAIVMAILRRSVSEKRAFELITGGEVLAAQRACEIGIINQVYPDDQFEAAVESYVAAIASRSASAVSLCKNLLYHMDGMTFEAAVESGVHLNAIARMTEDCKHGVEKFLNRNS